MQMLLRVILIFMKRFDVPSVAALHALHKQR